MMKKLIVLAVFTPFMNLAFSQNYTQQEFNQLYVPAFSYYHMSIGMDSAKKSKCAAHLKLQRSPDFKTYARVEVVNKYYAAGKSELGNIVMPAVIANSKGEDAEFDKMFRETSDCKKTIASLEAMYKTSRDIFFETK